MHCVTRTIHLSLNVYSSPFLYEKGGIILTNEAIELRRAYMSEYREKNRERINLKQRLWRKANKDKVSEYNKAYWNKKASELE